jgi:hypothetical protein
MPPDARKRLTAQIVIACSDGSQYAPAGRRRGAAAILSCKLAYFKAIFMRLPG